jgi:hypothetical protein
MVCAGGGYGESRIVEWIVFILGVVSFLFLLFCLSDPGVAGWGHDVRERMDVSYGFHQSNMARAGLSRDRSSCEVEGRGGFGECGS